MTYTWKEQNLFGDTALLAAAGAAIAAYNLCEFGLITIIIHVTQAPGAAAQNFIRDLNNAQRASLLRAHLEVMPDKEIKMEYSP